MVMGRPPKDPADRRVESMKVPLTEAEKSAIQAAAEADGMKPVTWVREAALRAAKRRAKG